MQVCYINIMKLKGAGEQTLKIVHSIYSLSLSILFIFTFHLDVTGQPISVNMLPPNSVRIIGGVPDTSSGLIAKSIGDFNGDGLNDLALSSPLEDKVYIILGRTSLFPQTINLSNLGFYGLVVSGNPGSGFGLSISALGDFIGNDGISDIAIGAPFEGEGGRIYVLKGGFSLTTVIQVSDEDRFPLIIEGGPGESIGQFIGDGGNLNGDRFDDLIFYDPLAIIEDADAVRQGAAYVIYGAFSITERIVNTQSLNPENSLTLLGPNSITTRTSGFANVFNFIGDINGDGSPELGLFKGISQTETSESQLIIIPGGEKLIGRYALEGIPLETKSIVFRVFPDSRMHEIHSLLGTDINEDGLDDLICGFGFGNLSGGTSPTGVAAIIPGSETIPTETIISDFGQDETIWLGHWQDNSGLGRALSTQGSLLAFGAPGSSSPFRPPATRTGAVYLVTGNNLKEGSIIEKVSSISSSVMYGRQKGDGFGISLDILGDINQDSLPELYVSAANEVGENAAVAYIIPAQPLQADVNGDQVLSNQDLFFFTTNWIENEAIGDLNNDGIINTEDLLMLTLELKLK